MPEPARVRGVSLRRDRQGDAGAPRPRPRIVPLALGVALLGLLLVLISGLGSRYGLWHFRTGFTLLRWGAFIGIGGAFLGMVAFGWARANRRRGQGAAIAAVLLGALAFLPPWTMRQRAAGVPPIHDITTDPDDPPAFQAILPLRADAANPPEYAGAEVAAQQRAAYPDIAPLMLDGPPAVVYERALAAADELGWEIVAADGDAGRIEAVATTTWFGFRDDVVIRVRPAGQGSVVDIRSKSRVGRSDMGANAARIRKFLSAVGS